MTTLATGKRPKRQEPNEAKSIAGLVDMVYLAAPTGMPQDEKVLQQMAEKIHGLMQTPPTGQSGAASSPEPVASEGGTEADSAADQEKWLAGLATSKAGQKLLDHLSHVEAAPHMRSSSAMEQAVAFRRIFIHALQKKSNPFGLPKKLPKYLAIVSFSGERLLMYSDNPCLIAFLSMGADGSHAAAGGVQQILDWALSSTCSVLLCYSLPFQAGFDAAYWDVRTVVRGSGGQVDDSYLVCNSWERQASKGTATLLSESQRTDVLDQQEEAFAQNMMACDLDVAIEPIDGIDPAAVFDEQNAKLLRMVSMLQNERRKMMADHKQDLIDLKAQHRLDSDKTCELLKVSFEKQRTDEDAIGERLQQAEDEVKLLRCALKGKDTELQQQKADAMLKEEDIKGKKNEVVGKVSELHQQIDKLTSQLKAKDRDKEQALSKQQQAHQRMHDQSERKFQSAKSESARQRQSAAEFAETARTVETAFENVCVEKTHILAQLTDARKHTHVLNFRLAMARARGNKLMEMMKAARMSHATAESHLITLTKQVSDYSSQASTIQEAAGAAAHESEELQKERDDLAARLQEVRIEREELLSAAELARLAAEEKPKTVDFGCSPEYDPRSAEIDSLKSEIATLNTAVDDKTKEVDQLKVDLARIRHRGKKQPPASFLPDSAEPTQTAAVDATTGAATVMGVPAASPGGGGGRHTQTQVNIMVPAAGVGNGGGHQPLSTDLGHDPNGDPMLEGNIQQMYMLMRTIADTARTSKSHERNARDAFAKNQAFESMGMGTHMQGGFYPPQYTGMYGPPQGPGHMNGHGMGYQ